MKQALLLACALAIPAVSLSQQASRPAITGVAFARFYTTDLPGAQHFYGSTLGFDGRHSGGTWVYPVNHSQWLEIVPATPPQAYIRMAAVGFTTRDASALQKYIVAKG